MTAHKRTRALLLAAAVACLAVLVGIVIVTRGFGLIDTSGRNPHDVAALKRCERDVLDRLMSPSTAKLSDVTVTSAELDPETTDLSSLAVAPLQGVDQSRITVRRVSGVVEAPNESGTMLQDPFTCRAYFVDGNLADALVVFEHDH